MLIHSIRSDSILSDARTVSTIACTIVIIHTDLASEALKAEPGMISHIMPDRFGEVLLRVYTRDCRRVVVDVRVHPVLKLH